MTLIKAIIVRPLSFSTAGRAISNHLAKIWEIGDQTLGCGLDKIYGLAIISSHSSLLFSTLPTKQSWSGTIVHVPFSLLIFYPQCGIKNFASVLAAPIPNHIKLVWWSLGKLVAPARSQPACLSAPLFIRTQVQGEWTNSLVIKAKWEMLTKN